MSVVIMIAESSLRIRSCGVTFPRYYVFFGSVKMLETENNSKMEGGWGGGGELAPGPFIIFTTVLIR